MITVQFTPDELRALTMDVRKRLDDIMPDHPDNETLHEIKDRLTGLMFEPEEDPGVEKIGPAVIAFPPKPKTLCE